MKSFDVELNSVSLQFFLALPGTNLLLLPDAPNYTIVATTGYPLSLPGHSQERLPGKGFFDASLFTPEDEATVRSSLDRVHREKNSHQFSIHLKTTAQAGVEESFLSISHRPVTNDDGEVIFIIHSEEDITTQIHAKREAESSKGIKKAYSLFMNAPVIIGILKGDDYVIELANEGLLEVWGRTADVIGKPLLQALPELAEQGFIGLMERVRETGEPFYAYEFPIKLNRFGKDEVLYFDFVYKPVYENTKSSKASGIISVGHDVTAQVIARHRIQESEAKYRSLFASMDQGFCVLEMIFDDKEEPLDYRFLETNPVFEKQTGLADAVGKTALELVPNLEKKWRQLYGKVARTGQATRFVEGSQAMGRWFEVYAYRMGDTDSRKVALLFTDITERRKSEEALMQSERNLRNTILQAPVAMTILRGPQFIVEIANERMYELWGMAKEKLVGRPIFEGLPEVRHHGYEDILMKVYATGKTFSALGVPVVLPRHGAVETVYVNLLFEAFRESNGSISGIMAVAIDVTAEVLAKQKIEEVVAKRTHQLAEANEALTRTNQELARSNENLEEFAYAASHDLKEPLRKIEIFSDRLLTHLQGVISHDDKKYFDRIQHATQRMTTLVDDLLTYSHVSTGAVKDEMVNLNQKVQLVLDDLEIEIEEKKASITVDPLPTIKGHPRQLGQLFQNLLGNAIKYSKAGVPPEIEVRCRVAAYDETMVPLSIQNTNRLYYLLEVKDKGIGFEPEDAERIFTVFTRLYRNTHKGTGIGLSIARKVVENHDGYIWAESLPNEGSTFKILLPVV